MPRPLLMLAALTVALAAPGLTHTSSAAFTSTSSSASSAVTAAADFAPLHGVDVQATNGGVLGRVDAGDTLRLSYSDRVDPASVIDGWDGTSRGVTVRLRDGLVVGGSTTDDTLDVTGVQGDAAASVALGSVNLGADYLKRGRDTTVAGTLRAAVEVLDGHEVTILVLRIDGTPPPNEVATTSQPGTVVWTPSSDVRDLQGRAGSNAAATETGPLDRDL